MIVSDSSQVMYSLGMYLQNDVIIWKGTINEIYNQIFPTITSKESLEKEHLEKIKWVIQGEHSDKLIKELEKQGINCELVGNYYLKWIKFNLYRCYS